MSTCLITNQGWKITNETKKGQTHIAISFTLCEKKRDNNSFYTFMSTLRGILKRGISKILVCLGFWSQSCEMFIISQVPVFFETFAIFISDRHLIYEVLNNIA